MIRSGQEGGRGVGILRDLAPIAAAAGAAALTVTLVVGPTTARLRSQPADRAEAALAFADPGRGAATAGGDVQVRVRPQAVAPVTTLTDAFDLVSVPRRPVNDGPTAPTFVVSARTPLSSSGRAAAAAGAPQPRSDVPSVVSEPVASPVEVVAAVPDVQTAEVPSKRQIKPLKPIAGPPAFAGRKDLSAIPGLRTPGAPAETKAPGRTIDKTPDKAADRTVEKSPEPAKKADEQAKKADEKSPEPAKKADERAKKADEKAAEQAERDEEKAAEKDEEKAKKADEKAKKADEKASKSKK